MTSSAWLKRAANAEFLVVDVETNGKDVREKGSGAIVQGLVLTFRDKTGINSEYFALNHKIGNNSEKHLQEEIVELLNNNPWQRHVFFNAKFDIVALQLLGVNVQSFYDTQSMAHWVNENLTKLWSLDNVCKLLGIPGKDMSPEMKSVIEKFGWGNVSAEMMRPYAVQDGISTLLLFEFLYPKFAAHGFINKIWYDEEEFIKTIAKMECMGVRIDQTFCKKETKKGEFRKMEILEELDFLKPTSGNDLKTLLIDKLKLPVLYTTPQGKPSFNKQAMKDYDAILSRSNNPTAKRVLEYRGWDKTVSSNYRAYLELVGNDGRLRCSYKLTGTKTSRTSCEKPNLQQIPKASDKEWNGKLKQAFIPDDGYSLWGFDYSNLELRVIAGYCGEPRLIEVFEKGLNVFDVMEKDLGFPREDVKTFYYATGYGAQDEKIALTLGIRVSEAARLRKTFYSTYARMGVFKEKVKAAAQRNLRIKLWTGRVRHFPNRGEAGHLAFNSLIQGSGAELVKNRMIALAEVIDWDTCRMLLLVHDELIFEIKEGMESHWHPIIKQVMEDVPEPLGKFVKFTVDCKKWGEK